MSEERLNSTSHAEAEEEGIWTEEPHMAAGEWTVLECAACMADGGGRTDSSGADGKKGGWSAV